MVSSYGEVWTCLVLVWCVGVVLRIYGIFSLDFVLPKNVGRLQTCLLKLEAIRTDMANNFGELVFDFLVSSSEYDCGKFAMLLWPMWRKRNELLWNSLVISVGDTIHMTLSMLADWLLAKNIALRA
ncbi:hypothetical protein PTKIN_Ptkin17bG0105200 [Pterospermum kingtungense]